MSLQSPTSLAGTGQPLDWVAARVAAYEAGRLAMAPARLVPLAEADGLTLAEELTAGTDLPAFATASVDGYATRGPGPWRITGRLLAGQPATPLADSGSCVEIATGAMVPPDADAIIRVEDADLGSDGMVSGMPRSPREWREPGDEARAGESMLPAGTPITPGVLGLAAACGYDTLAVRPAPGADLVVFGDELLTSGAPGGGRVRDALGPAVPAFLRRLGCRFGEMTGPVADTLTAHVDALDRALAGQPALIVTTGGTMQGPVDHLHAALHERGARYVANRVAVRPGFPMLLAAVDRPDGARALVAGLPGNPQSAFVALCSLVAPAVAGLLGRDLPGLRRIRLGEAIGGRGDFTHLALVRTGSDGLAWPVRHVGSAMLRGLARSAGFAVIPPGRDGQPGDEVELLAMPLLPGESG